MSTGFRRTLLAVFFVSALVYAVTQSLRRRQETDSLIYIPKPEVITPQIRLLQSYVRVNTTNPPGNETAAARLLIDELRKGGVAAELIESAPGRGNVYARLPGRNRGEGLLLLHHIDVVSADPRQWKLPPFEAKIQSNMMYGRGTLDTKGIGICHLQAFLALAKSGAQPERDLVFLATADEERGSHFGVAWLLQHRPDVFDGIRYAITEGGVTETIAERVTYFGVETGSKQYVEARLTAPERSTLERVRIALEPHFAPRDPQRVLPAVKEYFQIVAPHRVESGALLADIDQTIAQGKFWVLHPTYRELTQNTVVAQGIRKEGGLHTMHVALLNLPDEDPQRRAGWLRALVEPFGVQMEITRAIGPTGISSPQTPFFAQIVAAVQQEYGKVAVGPMILPNVTTDCRFLRARGIQCYGFWPYPVDFYQTKGIHGIDERLRLDWFMRGIELTRELVTGYVMTFIVKPP